MDGARRSGDLRLAVVVAARGAGQTRRTRCNFDELNSDIRDDLRARPYELVLVTGGYQPRTKPRYADAIRVLNNGARAAGLPALTPTESFAGRGDRLSAAGDARRTVAARGREISRDVIGQLKSLDLIAADPRAPTAGAPYAYVTAKQFLEVFGLASVRDLPDIEKLEDAGLLTRPSSESDLNGVLGLNEEVGDETDEAVEALNEP